MEEYFSFDDVLIKPQWSTVKSRADVSIKTRVANKDLSVGILSSNMDSVTGAAMAHAMYNVGGLGILHRFWSIEDNLSAYENSPHRTWCSVGIGKKELERAEALMSGGCIRIVLDVAHAAAQHVVDQTKELLELARVLPSHDVELIVGNFATRRSIEDFNYHLGSSVSAYKCNIGSGSACTTRMVTGCGIPSFSSLRDCISSGFDIIQDGGIKNSGDFAKAMGVGAKACILGGMLSGCEESPAEEMRFYCSEKYGQGKKDIRKDKKGLYVLTHKRYRGSASLSSYESQNKTAQHRTAEGESFLVPYAGTVAQVVQGLEAGLRSAMSYVGAHTLDEFKERCEFVRITNNGAKENGPHGRT